MNSTLLVFVIVLLAVTLESSDAWKNCSKLAQPNCPVGKTCIPTTGKCGLMCFHRLPCLGQLCSDLEEEGCNGDQKCNYETGVCEPVCKICRYKKPCPSGEYCNQQMTEGCPKGKLCNTTTGVCYQKPIICKYCPPYSPKNCNYMLPGCPLGKQCDTTGNCVEQRTPCYKYPLCTGTMCPEIKTEGCLRNQTCNHETGHCEDDQNRWSSIWKWLIALIKQYQSENSDSYN